MIDFFPSKNAEGHLEAQKNGPEGTQTFGMTFSQQYVLVKCHT